MIKGLALKSNHVEHGVGKSRGHKSRGRVFDYACNK